MGGYGPRSVPSGLSEAVWSQPNAFAWASRRSSLFDPADLDWRWDPILREARPRHRPPFGGGQSLQERPGGASLSGARTSRRVTERHLAGSEAGVPNGR